MPQDDARAVLVLVSDQYPTDVAGDGSFIADELPFLAARFDRVLVFPKTLGEGFRPLPANSELRRELAKAVSALSRPTIGTLRRLVAALFSRAFRAELSSAGTRPRKPIDALRLLYYIAKAEVTKETVEGILDEKGLSGARILLYSFWFDGCSFGLASMRRPGRASLTRAHGADLYSERHMNGYIPLRAQSLRALDAIACISEMGQEYLARGYPDFAAKMLCFPLGMRDRMRHGIDDLGDGRKYIVSCSSIVPLKRVGLMIDGLASLEREEWAGYIWVHFGGGPELETIREKAANALSPGSFEFMGETPRDAILRFYAEHEILCFVTTSSTEGRPMSVQEAQCFGIPVIATAVGGIPELVNDENGHLLSSDPPPSEIADALRALLRESDPKARREASRKTWERLSRAETNYAAFADFARRLIEKGN